MNGSPVSQALDLVQDTIAQSGPANEVDQMAYTDLHLRLPGDYLTKLDVASNAVALEIRSPFLDHELIEFAASLPLSSKMYRWRQKGLLRFLAKKYLPPESISRHKTGFGPPLADWLRGEWSDVVVDLVENGIARRPGLFQEVVVQQTVHEHLTGARDHSSRLWVMVCLELWFRMFVDRTMAPTDER